MSSATPFSRPLRAALVVLPALVFTIHVSGCTILGFGVGAIADHAAVDHTPRALLRIDRGARITVLLRDGSRIMGTFDGTSKMDEARYAGHRAAVFARDTAVSNVMPHPAERARLVRPGAARWGSVEEYLPGGILWRDERAAEPESLGWSDLVSLTREGRAPVTGTTIERWWRSGRLPAPTLIRIQPPAPADRRQILLEPREVAWNDVEAVVVPAGRNGKTAGLVVGMAADIIVVASLQSTMREDCGSMDLSGINLSGGY